jgi:hypothetical protein
VLKVGVAVDEDKAVAAAAPQCEARPEHDAAVTAEHDRETAAVERRVHRGGKAACDRRDPLRIQDPCLRVPDIAVRRHVNVRFIRRAEARMQACRAQRAGSALHAVGTEAKGRRHLDNMPNDPAKLRRLAAANDLRSRGRRPAGSLDLTGGTTV